MFGAEDEMEMELREGLWHWHFPCARALTFVPLGLACSFVPFQGLTPLAIDCRRVAAESHVLDARLRSVAPPNVRPTEENLRDPAFSPGAG
jgi:hypothetical protein